MKSSTILICFTLAMLFVSCQAVAIRPVYEYAEVEVDIEGEVMGSPVPDYTKDIKFTRAGVEVAMTTEQYFELFADVSWAEADYNDGIAVDGYEIGVGARSQWPSEPGWGLDWSGRISHFNLDEDDTIFGLFADDEVDGNGITLKGGPYYAVEVAEVYFLSPHAGLLYSMKRGNEESTAFGVKVADFDFEYDSFGVYVGARFNRKFLNNFDIAGDLFVGSSDLVGFMVSAGIRF